MQLKLHQILLFILSCCLLAYAETPGGSLIALAVLMQLALLVHHIELTRKAQFASLRLFLLSIPIFIFWGGVQSFVPIYFKQGQYLFCFMSLLLVFILNFILCLQVVFSYDFLESNRYELIPTLRATFHSIKTNKVKFTKHSLLFFFLSFVPWINLDWKLVFALTVTHLFLSPNQLKKVFLFH